MENLKSLADQLRAQIGTKDKAKSTVGPSGFTLLGSLEQYDTGSHKSMVHARFDEKTLQLLNYFKMATGNDVSKVVAFAVNRLIESDPDFKLIIKQFIQNLEL